MSTLRIISEDVPTATLTLTPGAVCIGRKETNQFQIVHPTVSGQHCELTFADGRLIVKDLNSTNGTFINDQVIQESALEPGQVLRLGDIRLLYEAPARARIHVAMPATPPPSDVAASEPGAAPEYPCYKHPRTEGEWICTQCRTVFCDSCSGKRVTTQKTWRRCTLCSSKVISLADHRAQEELWAVRNSLTFGQRLPGAFAYPFAKGGLIFLVLGTFIFWLVDLAKMIVKYVPFYGWSALIILLVFSWGWLFSYAQKIIASCSNDEDVLPEWPEISEWSSDLVQPFFACLGTLAICFGPALIYSFYAAENDMAPFFFYAIFLMGLVYLPMALLVVSLTGSLKSANPFVVLPAITKVPGQYVIVCLFFIGGLGLWNGLQLLSEGLMPVSKGPGSLLTKAIWKIGWNLPIGFVFLYCMVVCARVLGMMYRCNRTTFGWFKR